MRWLWNSVYIKQPSYEKTQNRDNTTRVSKGAKIRNRYNQVPQWKEIVHTILRIGKIRALNFQTSETKGTLLMRRIIFYPVSSIKYKLACAYSEDSNQSAHLHN